MSGGHYHLVYEYADGGTLREYLKNYFDRLTWKDKYKIGLEITGGLNNLHGLDIVHQHLVGTQNQYFVYCSYTQ